MLIVIMSAMRPNSLDLVRDTAKAMTIAQECDMARLVNHRAPTPSNRARLAELAFRNDDFETVIDLFEAAEEASFEDFWYLSQSYLARQTTADDAAARGAADRALALAHSPVRRAAALAARAKAERRLGLAAEARASLTAALREDPHNKDACKRLTALDLAEGRADAVVAWCDALAAQGVGHARLHGARVIAEAARGDLAAARRAGGFDLLGARQRLDPPAGWDDIDAFNQALATELLAHPGLRYESYGSASNFSWRIDHLEHARAPLTEVLLDAIARHVDARVAALAGVAHPWVSARPARALLRAWCVITDGDGFEGWHIHQFGWLSGVYYVAVPTVIVRGRDAAGCLAFGLPPEMAGSGPAEAFGLTMIRPEPGTMLTFPSHLFHRTFPHGAAGKRICVAFDVQPR